MKTESAKTELSKIESKEVAKYLRVIKKEMKLSPQFLADVQAEVTEYYKENPNVTFDELKEIFGEPPKKEREVKQLKHQIYLMMMIICLLVLIICTMFLKMNDMKRENNELLRNAIIYKADAEK